MNTFVKLPYKRTLWEKLRRYLPYIGSFIIVILIITLSFRNPSARKGCEGLEKVALQACNEITKNSENWEKWNDKKIQSEKEFWARVEKIKASFDFSRWRWTDLAIKEAEMKIAIERRRIVHLKKVKPYIRKMNIYNEKNNHFRNTVAFH
jgi:hypothetical protein